jgi:endonuclease I
MRYFIMMLGLLLCNTSFSQSIIHQEDFNICNSVSWTAVAGSLDNEFFDSWKCSNYNGRDYFEIYDGDGNNDDDWLISPAFNLDNYNKEYLSFEYDNSSDINGLEFLYSTNYSGANTASAIDAATWTALEITVFDIDNDAYTSNFSFQRAIDLSNISGSSVYFAFHFTSTSTTQGWGIDNIRIAVDYYENIINEVANGSKCLSLKSALHELIRGHERIEYTDSDYDVWDAFYLTDKRLNDAGTATIVYDVYSDNPAGAEPYEFTLGLDKDFGIITGAEGNYYNREHVMPQSWWGGSISTDTQYTDIQHILPCDQYVNTIKSNHPMGETPFPGYTTMNGSKRGWSTINGYAGNVFEPIDEYKGDFARILLYMTVRYQYLIPSWESNYAGAMTTDVYTSFEPWLLEVLICWHENDPVSQKEIDRNNAVYSIQKNRNPFIDHPEYAHFIWGNCGNVTCPITLPVELASFTGRALDNQQSLLSWATASESMSSHFEVEYSLDGTYFEHIGDVKSKGYSTSYANYQFTHKNASFGLNYYRLKSVDIDGQFEYSEIINIRHQSKKWVQLYPTLVENNIHLDFNESILDAEIQIFNTQGKLMLSKQLNNSPHQEIQLNDLSTGIYFVSIKSGTLVETERIFVK